MEVFVNPDKVLKYLLADLEKSRFFRLFGYSEENWERLQTDLTFLAENNPKRLRRKTEFGEEYEITGDVVAPNGRKMTLKSGWMIDDGKPYIIRFITAYPA